MGHKAWLGGHKALASGPQGLARGPQGLGATLGCHKAWATRLG